MFGTITLWRDPFDLIVLFLIFVLPILLFRPKIMVYIFLFILFFIPYSESGLIKIPHEIFKLYYGIYLRGGGVLPIPVLNVFLISIALAIIMQEIVKPDEYKNKAYCNLYKYFWIFNIFFFLYVLWGVGKGISVRENIILVWGVTNITNLTIFVFIMLRIFKTEEDVKKLIMLFMGILFIKNVWLVFRFFFLDGDPNNPYFDVPKFRISVYDGSEGLIISMAIFYALRILLNKGLLREISKKERLFYLVIVLTGIFNIIFSYRRTVWIGFLLVLLWLSLNISVGKRIVTGFFIIILIGILSMVSINRFQEREKGFFSDVATEKGEIELKGKRFGELYYTWLTMKENILFGVGPTGSHKAPPEFNINQYTVHLLKTVHSSIFYVGFKLGLVGLTIYLLFYAAYLNFWLKIRKKWEWSTQRLYILGETGFAGFLFLIPTILFAPLINEFRTMLLLGFCLALPYIAYNIENRRKAI
jgi:hypothetical protein